MSTSKTESTPYPELDLPSITWSTPRLTATSNLYLGVDNTQASSVGVFALGTDGFCFGYPIGGKRFKTGEAFRTWWEKHAGHLAGIATTRVPRDPFNCLAWLESQNQAIRRYYEFQIGESFMAVPSRVPTNLKVSYCLAQQVIYECEFFSILDSLRSHMQHIQSSIEDLERQLHRAEAVVSLPF